MKLCLNPVVTKTSRILILGTLPGNESLRKQQYYADTRNQFWSILSAVFKESVGTVYYERLQFIRRHEIALWDVVSAADREGSMDEQIKNSRINNFRNLFAKFPRLSMVVFNGAKPEKLFETHVRGALPLKKLEALKFIRLPNTSATPGRHVPPLSSKIEQWSAIRCCM